MILYLRDLTVTGVADIRAYNSVRDADVAGNTDDFTYGDAIQDIRAGSLKIVADGSIGHINNVLEIDSTGTTAAVFQAGGDVVVSEDSGDFLVGEVLADTSAGVIALYAQDRILNRNSTSNSHVIRGHALRLFSGISSDTGKDIGEAGTAIMTKVNRFEELSANSRVWVTNEGLLTAGDIANNRILQSSGDLEIRTLSPLQVDSQVIVAGDITFTASEDADNSADVLTITASADIQATGDVIFQAGDSIVMQAGAQVDSDAQVSFEVEYTTGDTGTGSITLAGSIDADSGLVIEGNNDEDTLSIDGLNATISGETEINIGQITLANTTLSTTTLDVDVHSELETQSTVTINVSSDATIDTDGDGTGNQLSGVLDVDGALTYTDTSGSDSLTLDGLDLDVDGALIIQIGATQSQAGTAALTIDSASVTAGSTAQLIAGSLSILNTSTWTSQALTGVLDGATSIDSSNTVSVTGDMSVTTQGNASSHTLSGDIDVTGDLSFTDLSGDETLSISDLDADLGGDFVMSSQTGGNRGNGTLSGSDASITAAGDIDISAGRVDLTDADLSAVSMDATLTFDFDLGSDTCITVTDDLTITDGIAIEHDLADATVSVGDDFSFNDASGNDDVDLTDSTVTVGGDLSLTQGTGTNTGTLTLNATVLDVEGRSDSHHG